MQIESSSRLQQYKLYTSTFFLYASLFATLHYPHSIILKAVALFSLLGISISQFYLPLSQSLCLLILLVPLEFSTHIPFIGALSPIDLYFASLIPVLIYRASKKRTSQIIELVGRFEILIAVLFLSYALLNALLLNGNIRGVLRWGEFFFAWVFASFAWDEDREIRTKAITMLAFGGVAMSAVALFQWGLAKFDYRFVMGTFHQHNILGAYLCLTLPSVWATLKRFGNPRWVKLGFILGISALIACYSRGAWVGFIAGLALLFFSSRLKSRVWILGLLSLFAMAPLIHIVIHDAPHQHIRLLSVADRGTYLYPTTTLFKYQRNYGNTIGDVQNLLPGN